MAPMPMIDAISPASRQQRSGAATALSRLSSGIAMVGRGDGDGGDHDPT